MLSKVYLHPPNIKFILFFIFSLGSMVSLEATQMVKKSPSYKDVFCFERDIVMDGLAYTIGFQESLYIDKVNRIFFLHCSKKSDQILKASYLGLYRTYESKLREYIRTQQYQLFFIFNDDGDVLEQLDAIETIISKEELNLTELHQVKVISLREKYLCPSSHLPFFSSCYNLVGKKCVCPAIANRAKKLHRKIPRQNILFFSTKHVHEHKLGLQVYTEDLTRSSLPTAFGRVGDRWDTRYDAVDMGMIDLKNEEDDAFEQIAYLSDFNSLSNVAMNFLGGDYNRHYNPFNAKRIPRKIEKIDVEKFLQRIRVKRSLLALAKELLRFSEDQLNKPVNNDKDTIMDVVRAKYSRKINQKTPDRKILQKYKKVLSLLAFQSGKPQLPLPRSSKKEKKLKKNPCSPTKNPEIQPYYEKNNNRDVVRYEKLKQDNSSSHFVFSSTPTDFVFVQFYDHQCLYKKVETQFQYHGNQFGNSNNLFVRKQVHNTINKEESIIRESITIPTTISVDYLCTFSICKICGRKLSYKDSKCIGCQVNLC